MTLPDKDNFRIYTRLSPSEVLERVRAVTLVPREFSGKGKLYLGRIGEDTFEMTRRIERGAYKSRIPVVPLLKFVPRFIKAKVGREGEFTTIDFEAQIKGAISAAWIFTVSIIAAPIVFAIVFTILFVPVMLFLSPGAKFNFDGVTAAKFGAEFGKYAGAWIGISLTMILFRIYDIYKYKKRYAEILSFEKQELEKIFDGQLAQLKGF